MEAVVQNGRALRFASHRMRNEKEILLSAFDSHPIAVQYFGWDVIDSSPFLQKFYKTDGNLEAFLEHYEVLEEEMDVWRDIFLEKLHKLPPLENLQHIESGRNYIRFASDDEEDQERLETTERLRKELKGLSFDDVTVYRKIGDGAFAITYLCQIRGRKGLFALKTYRPIFLLSNSDGSRKQMMERDGLCLRTYQKNVVSILYLSLLNFYFNHFRYKQAVERASERVNDPETLEIMNISHDDILRLMKEPLRTNCTSKEFEMCNLQWVVRIYFWKDFSFDFFLYLKTGYVICDAMFCLVVKGLDMKLQTSLWRFVGERKSGMREKMESNGWGFAGNPFNLKRMEESYIFELRIETKEVFTEWENAMRSIGISRYQVWEEVNVLCMSSNTALHRTIQAERFEVCGIPFVCEFYPIAKGRNFSGGKGRSGVEIYPCLRDFNIRGSFRFLVVGTKVDISSNGSFNFSDYFGVEFNTNEVEELILAGEMVFKIRIKIEGVRFGDESRFFFNFRTRVIFTNESTDLREEGVKNNLEAI